MEKSDKFFIENPGCLKLILSQDVFEIVNPLGFAKKKHKVVGVCLWQICLLMCGPVLITCLLSYYVERMTLIKIWKNKGFLKNVRRFKRFGGKWYHFW